MPAGFEVPAGNPRSLRRAVLASHLTGAAGLVLLGVAFAGTGRAWLAAALVPALCVLLAVSLRRTASGQRGLLSVSPGGAAHWRADGAQPQALEPLRWSVLGGLVWIEGRAAGRRVRILSGRREMGDRRWRLLLAWLRWMDRGGAPAASLGICAGRPKLG